MRFQPGTRSRVFMMSSSNPIGFLVICFLGIRLYHSVTYLLFRGGHVDCRCGAINVESMSV